LRLLQRGDAIEEGQPQSGFERLECILHVPSENQQFDRRGPEPCSVLMVAALSQKTLVEAVRNTIGEGGRLLLVGDAHMCTYHSSRGTRCGAVPAHEGACELFGTHRPRRYSMYHSAIVLDELTNVNASSKAPTTGRSNAELDASPASSSSLSRRYLSTLYTVCGALSCT